MDDGSHFYGCTCELCNERARNTMRDLVAKRRYRGQCPKCGGDRDEPERSWCSACRIKRRRGAVKTRYRYPVGQLKEWIGGNVVTFPERGHMVYAAVDVDDNRDDVRLVKIGYSRDVRTRFMFIKEKTGVCLQLCELRECTCPIDADSVSDLLGQCHPACRTERMIQLKLDRFRVQGEWFDIPVGAWCAWGTGNIL